VEPLRRAGKCAVRSASDREPDRRARPPSRQLLQQVHVAVMPRPGHHRESYNSTLHGGLGSSASNGCSTTKADIVGRRIMLTRAYEQRDKALVTPPSRQRDHSFHHAAIAPTQVATAPATGQGQGGAAAPQPVIKKLTPADIAERRKTASASTATTCSRTATSWSASTYSSSRWSRGTTIPSWQW
jgi:hypothetical protein